jgi:dolichyl-phosphate-mannose-protein mannosyltransferase
MDQPANLRSQRLILAAVLGGALLVHLLLMPAPGWERDGYWFVTWMRTAVEHGVSRVAEIVWCDYPPGYLYVLKGTGLLWIALTGLPIPSDGALAARFLIKLVPALADLTTAWVLYRMAVPRVSRAAALVILAAYAYNPAMLFDSAVWGQVDSVLSLLVLAAVWAVCARRFALGGALAVAAVLVKLQAVVLLPALLLVAFSLDGLVAIFTAARGAALAALVLLLPFFLANRMGPLIDTMLGASGRYPYISMNAHNVWWLVGGAGSMWLSDAMRLGNGLLTYHTLGTVMLGVATLLILWRLWRELFIRHGDALPALLEACALQALAFYLFPTEMHERYVVPLLVFLAALCIWRPRCWWFYGIASGAVLVSLASTLHANYPQGMGGYGAFFPASRIDASALGVLFIGLFLVLLLWTADKRFRLLAPVVAGVATMVTAGVAAVPLRGAVRLSDWAPIAHEQQWGTLHSDRSVEGRRLSAFGFIFRHGIGTHAASKLTYHLNGAFRTFDTAFAVDDEANRGQMIRFRILTDGYPRFDSGNISAGGFPRHVRVAVDGAQFLTLEVLDGGDGINSDHADWLEPLLLR